MSIKIKLSYKYIAGQFPEHLDRDIEDFLVFKQFIIVELEQKNTLGDMDSTDIVNLHNWAQNASGRTQTQSRNILCFFYDSCYIEQFSVEVEPRSKIIKSEFLNNNEKVNIKCYPNPSGNWVAIEAIDSEWKNADLSITDISGRVIQRSVLKNRMYIWDVRDVPEGIYLIRVNKNGNIENVKVSVVH